MTALNTARGAIYTKFITDWGATSSFTLDNESYDPPANTEWVRVVVRHTDRVQESLGGVGSRKFESGGSVFIQCFAPLDTGAATADSLAQTARSIFEGITLTPEGIRFTAATITEIGPTEDWYQINVEATFTYTQTK
jgi:hypothetical protein